MGDFRLKLDEEAKGVGKDVRRETDLDMRS